jgi:uncharacterized protein (DUF4415 family)
MPKKKRSASSRLDKLINVSAEDIFNKPLTEAEQKMLHSHARHQATGDDSHINFEDVPPMTDEQLAQMTRFRDRPRKVAVSVRLDPAVWAWLKSKGERHLTRINDILANVMEAERRARRVPFVK